MFDRILVVCVGNICRSPFGEAVLKKLLPQKRVSSAGLATQISQLSGMPANKEAVRMAKDLGYCLQGHKAKQLTSDLCKDFDLILVMEKGHKAELEKIAPEATSKTMLFSHWYNKEDIPDPYRQSTEAFEHSLGLVLKSAEAWVKKL